MLNARISRVVGITGVLLFAGLFWRSPTIAASVPFGRTTPEVTVLSGNGTIGTRFDAYDESFTGGVHVAVGDVDGDGANEIITASGAGGVPEVKIFSLGGDLEESFMAYGKNFRGGVNVAAFDLDGDGRAEIITGPGLGGGPEVKIFSSDGTKRASFFAYDKSFHGGVNVTAGFFGAKNEPLIITGSGYGGGHVRGFTSTGSYASINLRPFGETTSGIVVAAVPVPSKRSRLMVSRERLGSATIKLFDLTDQRKPISAFEAYDTKLTGGAQISSADTNKDGESELIVAKGPGSEPRLKIFTQKGKMLKNILVGNKQFRAGSFVASTGNTIVSGPRAVALDGRADLYKYIEVDLSDQVLRIYINGALASERKVSTGKWATPTPVGTFAIKNKIPVAYSKEYDLYMEWWMAFTPDGSYGLHALPFWKLKNNGKRYEGVGHLGTPVSHGCIRQTIVEAQTLYRWADIGTAVIVKR